MPMTKAERRAYEAGLEADMNATDPRMLLPPSHVPNPCPAAIGRNHSFTMRGSDGVYRCFYCCKTRAQVEGQ